MKKCLAYILAVALLISALIPAGICSAADPGEYGFDFTQADSSMWKTGGWTAPNSLSNGVLSVTNGWGYYGGYKNSGEAFTFVMNTTATTGSLDMIFRNNVTQQEILTGDASVSTKGSPFILSYSAKSGMIFFKTGGKQLTDVTGTNAAGTSLQGLNDGENHEFRVVTTETDVTKLNLYVDGAGVLEAYYLDGVKPSGYSGFVTYAQKTFNITEFYTDGVMTDPSNKAKIASGFEDSTYAMSGAISLSTAEAHTGSQSVYVSNATAGNKLSALFADEGNNLSLNIPYRLTAWIKFETGSEKNLNLALGVAASNSYNGSIVTAAKDFTAWGAANNYMTVLEASDNGWYRILLANSFLITDSTKTNPYIYCYSGGTGGGWYIDDIEIERVIDVTAATDTEGCSISLENKNYVRANTAAGGSDLPISIVAGDTVTVTAIPTDGYAFSGLYNETEKVELTANNTFIAKNAAEYTAKFRKLNDEAEYVSYGFEGSLTASTPSEGITIEKSSSAAHSGAAGLHITKKENTGCWFYVALNDASTNTLKSGCTYRASMYIKTNPDSSASGSTTFNFYSATAPCVTSIGALNTAKQISNWGMNMGYGDYLDKAKDENDGEWTKYLVSREFTVTEKSPYIVMVVWAPDANSFDWYIDDIEFCELVNVNLQPCEVGGTATAEKVNNIYSLGKTAESGVQADIDVIPGEYACGDTVEINASSLDGYTLEGFYINGVKAVGTGDTYRFTLAADTSVSTVFESGYNILRAGSSNFNLTGGAVVGDTLRISGGSAVLGSLLLDNETLKLRFTSDIKSGTAKICLFDMADVSYNIVLSSDSIALTRSDTANSLCSVIGNASNDGAEHELLLSVGGTNGAVTVTALLDGEKVIDFTDTEGTFPQGLLSFACEDSQNILNLTFISVEGLVNTEFLAVKSVKDGIDSSVKINLGSDSLSSLNNEFSALDSALKELLPNTSVLQKVNSVFSDFTSCNLPCDGLVTTLAKGNILPLEDKLQFSFRTDESANLAFENAGFTRITNGAVILPGKILGDSSLYANTAGSEICEFIDNGSNDISRFHVTIDNWTSRERRNTSLCARGYSVYSKDGVSIYVYSKDISTESPYSAAVKQYNIMLLKSLETSIFNGELALLYLSGDTESQVIDINMADISDNVKTIGRTSYSDTALIVDRACAGFAISGKFKGDIIIDVSLYLNNISGMYVYSVIDDDYDNARKIALNEDGEYIIASFAQSGEHTIQLIKATEGGYAKLDVNSIKITGMLYDAPAAKELSIEFLGDSITSGWGVYTYEQLGLTGINDSSLISDSNLTYAAITGRNLNADISVISRSGVKTEQIFDEQYYHIHDRDNTAWSFATHPDIIVANLGQNDVSTYASKPAEFTQVVKEKLAELRTMNPDAVIVWANGMMSTNLMSAITDAVSQMNDSKMLSVCLPTDTNGQGSHPSVSGHQRAAEVLTEFLRENALPLIHAGE